MRNPLDVVDEPPAWMRDLAEQIAEEKRAIAIRRALLGATRKATQQPARSDGLST